MSHSSPTQAVDGTSRDETMDDASTNASQEHLTTDHGGVFETVVETDIGLALRDSEMSDNDEDSDLPHIDVVHVTARSADDEIYSLNDLFQRTIATSKRGFVFRFDLSYLLLGDLIQQYVEQQAARLLRGLLASERTDSDTRRAIVFVAYDLGCLIVEMAVSLAARFKDVYPRIFSSTARIVFSGCPLRSSDTQEMSTKLFRFLSDKNDEGLSRLLIPTSVDQLAHCLLYTSGMFVSSNITLRSRIISLYANEKQPGRIHFSFDAFISTLGITSETSIEEQNADGLAERFPALTEQLACNLKRCVPLASWVPVEQTLIALSAPLRQSNLSRKPNDVLLSGLGASLRLDWSCLSGSQILYIHGASDCATHDMADRILFDQMAKLRKNGKYGHASCLSFTFDSKDPRRDSISNLVASILVQVVAGRATGSTDVEYHLLQDMFLMRGGWTDESSLSALEALRVHAFDSETVLLLHDFDECRADSRTRFLHYYTKLASGSEYRLKLLVTSRKPNALVSELSVWPQLNVDDLSIHTGRECFTTWDDLPRFCPTNREREQIQIFLDSLSEGDTAASCIMVQMLQNYSSWPKVPSYRSLRRFINLVDLIFPTDTPTEVLDKILKSDGNLEDLRWGLSWLLCGYRPLSHQEFAAVMCHSHHHQHADEPGTSIRAPPAKIFTQQHEPWLRMIADFSHNQVAIRREIWNLLEDSSDTNAYIWNQVKQEAHQNIVEFCLAYLASPSTDAILWDILRKNESYIRSYEVAVPVTPDGQELLFYVVQALPHHLSKCPPSYSTNVLQALSADHDAQTLMLWAKAYWAMSNPLSRPSRPPESALSVLAGASMLPYEEIKTQNGIIRLQYVIVAVLNGMRTEGLRFLEEGNPSLPDCMQLLNAAIQAGDQSVALKAVHAVLSSSEENFRAPKWPNFAVWAATWLNMPVLVDVLLHNGVSANPEDPPPRTSQTMSFSPSLLYMASMLGHATVVKVLFENDASADVLRSGTYGSFQTAANRGHIEVLREYLDWDISCLESKLPYSGLFYASSSGHWRVVHELVGRGADPNSREGSDDGWAPLVNACQNGLPRTVEALLTNGADPNARGPYNADTALWFATVRAHNIECVRAILDHGGDPNHEYLKPPLMIEMVDSEMDDDTIIDVLDVLLDGERRIDINASNSYGSTALMLASRTGRLPLVRYLCKKGANVELMDDLKRTALSNAVEFEHKEVVEALLETKPKVNILCNGGETPLLFAALDRPEIFKLLLDADADPNFVDSYGDTVINKASVRGKTDIVMILIQGSGVEVDVNHKDSYGWPPICDAISCANDAAMVRLLADNGADLNVTVGGMDLLRRSIDSNLGIMQILLEFRNVIDINAADIKGQTALHAAAKTGKIEHLRLLIRAGADLNAQDAVKETALHHAVRQNETEILSVLLAQPDIQPNLMAPRSDSPLHLACKYLHIDCVHALLNHGADVKLANPNNFRSTPLMACLLPESAERNQDASRADVVARMLVYKEAPVQQAVRGSRFYTALAAASLSAGVGTLNFLLDQGASLQQADPVSGRLPLHFAAANGIENFQAAMLSYRGDPMAPDREGKTCLHWAAQFGNRETVEFILARLGATAEGQPARCVDQCDSDGWTPLCWAARPCSGTVVEGMRSEERDFAGVVRVLLGHGADRTVHCRLGFGASAERLTPLDLARRCDSGPEIIEMLKESGVAAHENACRVRRYALHSTCCDICLNPIFGLAYKCESCADYDVCTKCYPHLSTFHTEATQEDGKPHSFKERDDREEYKDLPLPVHAHGHEENDDEPGDQSDRQKNKHEEDEERSEESWNEDLDDIDV